MKRAVIYARYSSSTQTEQSIEGQVRTCTDYAKAKGLTVVGEYVDRAISGRAAENRPDFQRLMQDCSKGLFDAVIVYRTDRFARNKYDSAIYKRQLKKAHIELHYAAEHIPDGPEGIILESLMEGLAEYYSAELSQKVKRGIRESALKAKSTGGAPTLGYDVTADKSFVINEHEAETVKIIFNMYLQQTPNVEICKFLNDRGVLTKQKKPFIKSSIPAIIQNEKYMGVYKCGDVRLEDAVPAIVSKEIFLMAQNETNKRRTSKQVSLPKADYLLSGKLFCGLCKRKMVGVSGTSRNGNKFYYYQCPAARGKQKCAQKHIGRDKLESLVVEATLSHVLAPEAIKYISTECFNLQVKYGDKNEEVEYYQKLLADNKRALNNTLRAIESGVVTETLPARLRELELEQVQLEKEIKNAEARNLVLTPEHIAFMLQQFATTEKDEYEHRKAIIKCFVSEVHLYPEKLVIYYNIRSDSPLSKSDFDLVEDSEVFEQRSSCSTSLNSHKGHLLWLFFFCVSGVWLPKGREYLPRYSYTTQV